MPLTSAITASRQANARARSRTIVTTIPYLIGFVRDISVDVFCIMESGRNLQRRHQSSYTFFNFSSLASSEPCTVEIRRHISCVPNVCSGAAANSYSPITFANCSGSTFPPVDFNARLITADATIWSPSGICNRRSFSLSAGLRNEYSLSATFCITSTGSRSKFPHIKSR